MEKYKDMKEFGKEVNMRKRKWKDNDIIEWAKIYARDGTPFLTLEKEIEVPHATIHWCFRHRLQHIDDHLYKYVVKRMKLNKRRKKQ